MWRTGRPSGHGCRWWRRKSRNAWAIRWRPESARSTLIRGPTDARSPLKADPAAQLRLLDLQSLDSRADLLRHQRDTLPEIAEMEQLAEHQREVESQRIDQQMIVDDL